MIGLSSCLAGINCRWDGGNRLNETLRSLVSRSEAIVVCPEQLGGLPTPRPRGEILAGTGEDVLDGKARVVTEAGGDVTPQYIKGAYGVLRILKESGVKKVVLKARSSSCGYGEIYDGTFTGRLKKGNGVTIALLLRNGICVTTDEEYLEKIRKYGR